MLVITKARDEVEKEQKDREEEEEEEDSRNLTLFQDFGAIIWVVETRPWAC
jgi:hypothetical protein